MASDLFIPDIYPSAGGIGLHQAGKHITIPDDAVEQFVRDLVQVRRQQLINDCNRIAGVV
jgi:hypothetical protein